MINVICNLVSRDFYDFLKLPGVSIMSTLYLDLEFALMICDQKYNCGQISQIFGHMQFEIANFCMCPLSYVLLSICPRKKTILMCRQFSLQKK